MCCCKNLVPVASQTRAEIICYSTDDSSLLWVWGDPVSGSSVVMNAHRSGENLIVLPRADSSGARRKWFIDVETGIGYLSETNSATNYSSEMQGLDEDGNCVSVCQANNQSTGYASYKVFSGGGFSETSFPSVVPTLPGAERSWAYGLGIGSRRMCQVRTTNSSWTSSGYEFIAKDFNSGLTHTQRLNADLPFRRSTVFNFSYQPRLVDSNDDVVVSVVANLPGGGNSGLAVFHSSGVRVYNTGTADGSISFPSRSAFGVAVGSQYAWLGHNVGLFCVDAYSSGVTEYSWRFSNSSGTHPSREIGKVDIASNGDAFAAGAYGIVRVPAVQPGKIGASPTTMSLGDMTFTWTKTPLSIAQSYYPAASAASLTSGVKIEGDDWMVIASCVTASGNRSVVARLNGATGDVIHSQGHLPIPGNQSLQYAGGNHVYLSHSTSTLKNQYKQDY